MSKLKDVKCEKTILYNSKNKPYFGSLLDSAKSLFESCKKCKDESLTTLKNTSKKPKIEDVADYLILCYINPECILKNVKECKEEYNKIIKNEKNSNSKESLNEIKDLAKKLVYGKDGDTTMGIIHAIKPFENVISDLNLVLSKSDKLSDKKSNR